MHWDVVDLREFYASSLGRMAARTIRQSVRRLWPQVQGLDVLGLGYTSPFLGQFRGEATRVLNFMPSGQGVVHWPPDQANQATLVEEGDLPLGDGSVDRILLVHAIETSESLGALMKEAWRVLAPGGRLMVIVPNRLSLWARADRTPYGYGRPFSKSQLISLLRHHDFSLEESTRALFFPPFTRRFFMRGAPVWERVGARLWWQSGGVILAEASKRIYALPRPEKARLPLRVVPHLRPAAVQSNTHSKI
ncbi:MAG: methyltransferase domain-containing protein [Alphaproteobacteria bacterium]|nr:MAG: methyltransferase domain-containing protein [Alphaproteobacteria bacterium]